MTKNYIRWFSEIGVADVALAGGKNALLGEMVRELGTQGMRVPGSEGRVYAGLLPFTTTHIDVTGLPRPQTHMMVNIANPDTAFQTAPLPNDGVGLARMEFIVAEHIRAHPMALVHPEKIEDASVREEITRLTRSYAKPADYFVRQLSEGVATIAAAFYPKPVIVRMSDFKTNENMRACSADAGSSRPKPTP